MEPSTPLDVRRGLTEADGVHHTLRWGLIGAGSISSDWAKCLQKVPGAVLSSVAARDSAKAAAFAEKHGVKSVSPSYQELVASPEVDIVYVGTITALHKEHAMLAIEAGKHCLCEKPIALTVSDAEEMFAAAKAKGLLLLEGMWSRFFPAMEHARAAIEQGQIGDVVMAQSDFPDRCYAVQLGPFAFGTETEVTNVVSSMHSPAASTGGGAAVVNYGDKGHAIFSFPPWTCEFQETCELVGTKGRITLDEYGHCPTRITIRTTPEVCKEEPQGHTSTSQNGVEPGMQTFSYPVPQPKGYPAPDWHYTNQTGFVYMAQAIHRCLAKGLVEVPQYTPAESLHIMALLDKIGGTGHD